MAPRRIVRVKGSNFKKKRIMSRRRALKKFVRRTVFNMSELRYRV